jgi:hypothetical protein
MMAGWYRSDHGNAPRIQGYKPKEIRLFCLPMKMVYAAALNMRKVQKKEKHFATEMMPVVLRRGLGLRI